MKKFYEVPTQVKFLESENVVNEPRWLGGIAFEIKVICGECGGIVELNDIADIVELPCVNISEEILGDEE